MYSMELFKENSYSITSVGLMIEVKLFYIFWTLTSKVTVKLE